MKKAQGLNAFIILTTMIIAGCGGGNSVLEKKMGINAQMSEVRPITNDERNIATRICYAYQSKSKNFRSSGYVGSNFRFGGKKTDCQNVLTNYEIPTKLQYDDNNNLIYSPTAGFDQNLKFNRSVQTDSFGYLAQLCPKVMTNQTISNTFEQQNLRVQIIFFRENFDGFVLQYFTKQANNTYKIDSIEKFKVRSLIDFTTGKILGMDEYYSYEKACTSELDKKPSSLYEQSFISQ